MRKKKKLNEAIGGMVSRSAFSNLYKNVPSSTSLKSIVEDIYGQEQKFDANGFMSEVAKFNTYGEHIYREGNLKELAVKLSRLAETAKQHTLQETEDWFDKITVNRNMKELTGLSNQFKKVATEAQSLQERMSGLYEDMGHILGRYYEINEDCGDDHDGLEEVDSVREGTYQDFFNSAMKKFGVSSPDELEDENKKKFYDYVDKNWSAEKETD